MTPSAPCSPRRRAAPAAVLALVLSVLLGGVVPMSVTSPAAAQAASRRVVVVGDSIVLGARTPLVGAFEREGWATTFDAEVSRSTLAGAEAVRRRSPELTDTLVVSLGANDAGSTAAFRQRVDAVLAAAMAVPHVYWLTIREVRPYYAPANEVLRAAAATHPNLHLIDWNGAAAGSTGLTAGDGLHLTGAGAGVLAFLVASTVLSAPTATTLPPTTVPVTTVPVTTVQVTTVPVVGQPATATPAAGSAAAPSSTSRATTTTAPTEVRRGSGVAVRAEDDGGAGGLGWSVGLRLLGVVVVLAVSGAWIAVWSMLRSRGRAAPPAGRDGRSARSRLRAAHIAASREHHPSALPTSDLAGAEPPRAATAPTPSGPSASGHRS